MKKIYTIVGAALIAASASAQSALRPADNLEIQISKQRSQTAASSTRGTAYFCEDFSNGLDGANGWGAWTTGGNNGDVWALADANSPAGAYSTNLDPMASPTAANGWVIFDADLAQGGPITGANPAEAMQGWLVTPELDMSELENVKVEFNQYFRYCCAQLSPLAVEVSIDGGTTWTSFNATGILNTSANQLSANPLLTTIDISCVAALQPSVYVRWAYNAAFENGYSHYFWGLDDICIFETAIENDLEITQVTNGDILQLWEYKVTPIDQAITEADGGMVAGVIWRNNGRQDQTNVSIVIEVLDETGTTVLNTTSIDPFTMPAPANEEICPAPVLDTLFISTGFVPADLGIYQVRATISSDEGDDVPENNSQTRFIEYTTDEYGHNDAALSTSELRGRASTDNPDLFIPYGVGNIFTFPNAGSTAYGLTVEFGPNADGGLNFLAALYTDQSTTSQAYQLETFEYHTLYDQWIDAGPIYFPFADALSMSTEEVYMVTIETEEETIEECTVRVEPNSDNDNSTSKKDFNSNQQLVWFFRNSYSPAIRLITSERVMSVEENSLNQAAELNIYPNPASTEARIDFNLAEAGNVAYEVRDINGKLIKFDNVGKYNVGNNTFTVDVNSIATGSYFMSVVSGGKVIAHKQFIVKH